MKSKRANHEGKRKEAGEPVLVAHKSGGGVLRSNGDQEKERGEEKKDQEAVDPADDFGPKTHDGEKESEKEERTCPGGGSQG